MTFLANNNGKPARSVVFAAIAGFLVTQVVAPLLAQQGIALEGERAIFAVGAALYVVERAYRFARRYSWFSALDPWTDEAA